jgi:hypothetical protein
MLNLHARSLSETSHPAVRPHGLYRRPAIPRAPPQTSPTASAHSAIKWTSDSPRDPVKFRESDRHLRASANLLLGAGRNRGPRPHGGGDRQRRDRPERRDLRHCRHEQRRPGQGRDAEGLTINRAIPPDATVVAAIGTGYQGVHTDEKTKATVATRKLPRSAPKDQEKLRRR